MSPKDSPQHGLELITEITSTRFGHMTYCSLNLISIMVLKFLLNQLITIIICCRLT